MADWLSSNIQTCKELLKEYAGKKHHPLGEKLKFGGVGERDVYNITAPFEDEGETVIAGRVEGRDTEYSEVLFFTCAGDTWVPRKNTRSFKLQDPFQTKIDGELVFGGVEVWAEESEPGKLYWRTLFYKGKNINNLELFAAGPDGMKDIRPVELRDGRVGVFTRPQGAVGGRGQIGFTIIEKLEDLNAEVILRADLIKKQFTGEEWGGANEPRLLKNGLIGILGHIACYDENENRHYYSMAFSVDPVTRGVSPMKIIATRDNFMKGPAKKPDLVDVIFSGGLVRNNDATAVLYVGASDVEAHRIVIPDPFEEYEVC